MGFMKISTMMFVPANKIKSSPKPKQVNVIAKNIFRGGLFGGGAIEQQVQVVDTKQGNDKCVGSAHGERCFE